MHTTGMAGGYDYHTALHNGLLMDKAIMNPPFIDCADIKSALVLMKIGK